MILDYKKGGAIETGFFPAAKHVPPTI